MHRWLIALFVCLIAGTAFAQLEQPFIGGWELETIVQPDGATLTPEDLGHTVQLDFQSDGRFIRYQDGAMVHEGQWMLSNIWVMYFGQSICLDILQTTGGDDWHSPSGVFFSELTLRRGDPEAPTVETYAYLGVTDTQQRTLGGVRALYR